MSSDAEYQGSEDDVDREFGARRWVTFWSLVAFALIAGVVCILNTYSETCVALLDGLLIVMLIAYRIAKPFFDPTVKMRSS